MQFKLVTAITLLTSFGGIAMGMAVDVEKLAPRAEDTPAAGVTARCDKLQANLGDYVILKGTSGKCAKGKVTASMPDTVGVDSCCGAPQRFWNRCDIVFVFPGC